MCLLTVLDSHGIVVKCTAAIFFRTVDCDLGGEWEKYEKPTDIVW